MRRWIDLLTIMVTALMGAMRERKGRMLQPMDSRVRLVAAAEAMGLL